MAAGQLAIESADGRRQPAQILWFLLGTLAVFWLVHAYADALGKATAGRTQTLSFPQALRLELPIVESALFPALAILSVAVLGGACDQAAFAGLVAAAIELGGWVVLASRRAGLRGRRLVAHAAGAVLAGALLVLLKFLLH